MSEKLKILSPLLLVAAVAAAGLSLLRFEGDYLWKAQELNLFLDTPLFLSQQMVASGWLLTWLGTYFTQFFYHEWQGVALLCLWWAVLLWVLGRTFRVPRAWAAVLLVPLAALLLTDVTLGYWLYYLKLRGHFFAATIGTTVAVASLWLWRLLPARYGLRPLYMVVSTVVLYPLVGFYGLLSTLLMVIMAWRLPRLTVARRALASAVGLAAVGVWPLVCYNHLFHQTSQGNIWFTGLPLFVLDKEYAAYYTPYYILCLSLAVLAAVYGLWPRLERVRRWQWAVAHVALAALVAWGVSRYWYRDYNFHKELRLQRLTAAHDWQGVLAEAATADEEPTRAIVMLRNLALFRLGRQGDEMYHYRTGAKASTTPMPISMTQVVGRAVYYHYGMLNYCYRWCLEDGVEFGWRAEQLKYLALCSLVSGEERVARKYFRLLHHTRYHGEWAARYERYLGHRSQLLADKEFEPIVRLMSSPDMLGSDNTLVEKFLMTQFLTCHSTDKLYQEQALIAALWMKDIPTFWPRFFEYAQSHAGEHMPTHYQEAAYLYGQLEHQVDTSRMPFDEGVKQTYQDFMALAQQCRGMSEEQMRQVFYPRFGHTFYYEYFLIRNQKLY